MTVAKTCPDLDRMQLPKQQITTSCLRATSTSMRPRTMAMQTDWKSSGCWAQMPHLPSSHKHLAPILQPAYLKLCTS